MDVTSSKIPQFQCCAFKCTGTETKRKYHSVYTRSDYVVLWWHGFGLCIFDGCVAQQPVSAELADLMSGTASLPVVKLKFRDKIASFGR